ncbi:unnamed protein product [Urochloa humidicola]
MCALCRLPPDMGIVHAVEVLHAIRRYQEAALHQVLEQETHNLEMQTYHPNSQSTLQIRNLPEKQLGGVIFGGKPDTIEECLTKQLFGLQQESSCGRLELWAATA